MADGEVFHYECINRYNPLQHGHGKEHIPIDPGDSLEVNCSALEISQRRMPEKVQVIYLWRHCEKQAS